MEKRKRTKQNNPPDPLVKIWGLAGLHRRDFHAHESQSINNVALRYDNVVRLGRGW